MYFDGKPSKFQTDRLRVNFAASLLSGQAMDWWDTVIVEEPPSPIRMNWDLFVQHLVQLFGERDMPRKAARELRELKMGHNDKITRYLISFAKIAPFTGWNDPALLFQFYEGLPDRLKDALCKVGYPATLSALQTLAIDFDGFYWDRERERRRTFPPAIPNANYRPPPPTRSVQTSRPAIPTSQTNTTAAHRVPASSPDANRELSKVLTADGRLNDMEKERRKRNGLCLYCAEKMPRHSPNCRWQARNVNAAGRTAFTTTELYDDISGDESVEGLIDHPDIQFSYYDPPDPVTSSSNPPDPSEPVSPEPTLSKN